MSTWTLKDDLELKALKARLEQECARRAVANGELKRKLAEFANKKFVYHEIGLGAFPDFIMEHRWELVEILTQGDYSTRVAIQEFKS